MSIFRSFWVVMNYRVEGQMHYWYCGFLEINMSNALERVAGKACRELIIQETSDRVWSAFDHMNRFGVPATFKVYMEEEMPRIIDKEHTTVYDHRPKDKFWQDGEEARPPREGFKQLPMAFKL